MVNELIEAFKKQSGINLPELGGFMKMGDSFMFNEFLKFNDGKLSSFLQEERGLNKEEADKKVVEFVSDIKAKLANNEKYDFLSIGILSSENGKLVLAKATTSAKQEIPVEIEEKETPTEIIEETKEPLPSTEPIIEEVKPISTHKTEKEETSSSEGYLSIHFNVKEATEKINQLSDKQDLIEFTSGDKRKSIIEALNKKLNVLNKIDPNELDILNITQVKESKKEGKEVKIEEGSDKEIKKQVAKESDILNTIKEKEEKEEILEVPPVVPEKDIKEPVSKKEEPILQTETPKEKVTAKEEIPVEETEKEKKDKEALIAGSQKLEKEAKGRKRSKIILLLALICIISGGGIVGYLKADMIKGWFSSTDKTIAHSDDSHKEKEVSKENHPEEVTEEPETVSDVTEEEVIVEETTHDISEESEVIEEVAEIEEEIEEEIVATPVHSSNSGDYHVIVGSFSKEKNATQLVKDLKKEGYTSASILGTFNGLQSVSMGNYPSKDEAKKAMEQSGKDGWIKKM